MVQEWLSHSCFVHLWLAWGSHGGCSPCWPPLGPLERPRTNFVIIDAVLRPTIPLFRGPGIDSVKILLRILATDLGMWWRWWWWVRLRTGTNGEKNERRDAKNSVFKSRSRCSAADAKSAEHDGYDYDEYDESECFRFSSEWLFAGSSSTEQRNDGEGSNSNSQE
jgi:hypothetical protein